VSVLGITLLVGGCGLGTEVLCTTEVVPSLRIEVVDSITGDPITDSVVWVRDGAYQDTLPSFEGTAWGPDERPGTYEVHVEKADYAQWIRSQVRVTQGECHVETRELVARLQPAAN